MAATQSAGHSISENLRCNDFFGGCICIQTKHVEGRSLINAASAAHMRKDQCLQFLQVSTFSSSSVLCYFFGGNHAKRL